MSKFSKAEILSYIGIFTLAIAYIVGIVFFSVPDKKEEKIFEIWQNKDLTFDEKDAIEIAKKLGYNNLHDAHNDNCIYWTSWNDDCEYEEDENGVLTYIAE